MNDPKPGTWDTELAVQAPLLQRLLELWRSKGGADRLPSRREFDPLDMRFCLGSVFLAETVPEADDFRYTLIGSDITRHVGVDNTGRLVGDVFGDPGLALYRAIRDEGHPIRIHGVVDWRGKDYKAYESVILPLADNGRTVDRFIGGMVFGMPQP